MQVTIVTRTTGHNFGIVAEVQVFPTDMVIHETFPYGMGFRSAAYDAAAIWAEEQGHTIVHDCPVCEDSACENKTSHCGE
jgi:hypothetical protein